MYVNTCVCMCLRKRERESARWAWQYRKRVCVRRGACTHRSNKNNNDDIPLGPDYFEGRVLSTVVHLFIWRRRSDDVGSASALFVLCRHLFAALCVCLASHEPIKVYIHIHIYLHMCVAVHKTVIALAAYLIIRFCFQVLVSALSTRTYFLLRKMFVYKEIWRNFI